MESRKLTKLEIFLIVIVFALLAIIFSFTLNNVPTTGQSANPSSENKNSQKVNTYYGVGDSDEEGMKNATLID